MKPEKNKYTDIFYVHAFHFIYLFISFDQQVKNERKETVSLSFRCGRLNFRKENQFLIE